MLDTNIAIELRDNAEGFADRLAALNARPALSAISLVELEGGVAAIPDLSRLRRARLDIILATFEIIDFTHAMAVRYGEIVSRIGFSRRKIIDRMIAVTAMMSDLSLITANAADFDDIPDLNLIEWPI